MSINGRRKEILPFDTEGYSEFRHRAACLAPDEPTARGTVLVRPENSMLKSQLRDPSKRNYYFDILKMAEAEVTAYIPYLKWFQLCEENYCGEIEIPQTQLKLCHMCQANELEEFGKAFLKPEHQMPLATVCTEHGCGLINVATPEDIRNPLNFAEFTTSWSFKTFHSIRLDLSLVTHGRTPHLPPSPLSTTINQLLQNDAKLAREASHTLGWGDDVENAKEYFFGVLFLITRPGRSGLNCAINEFFRSHEKGAQLSAPVLFPTPKFEPVKQRSMNIFLDIVGSLCCSNDVNLQHRLLRTRSSALSEHKSISSALDCSAFNNRWSLIALEMHRIDANPNFDLIASHFPNILAEWSSAWHQTMSTEESSYRPSLKRKRSTNMLAQTRGWPP